jgi:hypothetical protein
MSNIAYASFITNKKCSSVFSLSRITIQRLYKTDRLHTKSKIKLHFWTAIDSSSHCRFSLQQKIGYCVSSIQSNIYTMKYCKHLFHSIRKISKYKHNLPHHLVYMNLLKEDALSPSFTFLSSLQ